MVGEGTARVGPACVLGRVLGLGLAASLPTKLFFVLGAGGLCLSPRREPTACQGRPHSSLGYHQVQMGHAGPSFVKL